MSCWAAARPAGPEPTTATEWPVFTETYDPDAVPNPVVRYDVVYNGDGTTSYRIWISVTRDSDTKSFAWEIRSAANGGGKVVERSAKTIRH